ncbi:response regulator [Tengunoibacter tsumagoiensis]|uniref:Response regulatory domain-containing protein n=1 Tax=Tengunoibacter tsumagoiensis TaxID=2014871 RepID=A0A402A7K7_9CHLR|nr:response regulator [Tengunoibacter tsumagoiensis]GCE15150.1 hypothetical protein KTT_50090 [Tengunoibacter tsumagoiensis]
MSKRILLADDDRAILEAIKAMLEDEGYEVEATPLGARVIDLCDDPPAVLIQDIWMGGVDGRDICKALRQQEKTKELPIILISANRDVRQIAQEVGANDFLVKPFDIDNLLNKVQNYT